MWKGNGWVDDDSGELEDKDEEDAEYEGDMGNLEDMVC